MDPLASTRVDKWLWCVRLYKTRTLAAQACAAGHVLVNGKPVKPSRPIRAGDVVIVSGELIRTVKAVGVLDRRVGAKLVSQYLEDLTPPAEYEKQRERGHNATGHREKGAGRPTKRDRRVLSSFFGTEE
jgi:ribosome-associated heat shock protein Hsp15